MAEIKSALEIAMERAAALGAGQDDSRRAAQDQGRAAARRLLEGETEPAALRGLPAGPARHAAAESLLAALSDRGPLALEGLQALAGEGDAAAAWSELAQATEARQAALDKLHRDLAQEMAVDLAAVGIGGTALWPNPLSHPDYAARSQEALAGCGAQFKAAGERLLEALGE